MSDIKIETIRKMCVEMDIGYSHSSKQFTALSQDRVALKYLLEKHDALEKENQELRRQLDAIKAGSPKPRNGDWE